MSVESYAGTRCQQGHSINQDAFLITRGTVPLIALCDGAGQAQQVARRALSLLERLFKEADAESVALFPTWIRWTRTLDSALLGGAESTLVALAILEDRIAGTCVGDSRAYLWSRDGTLRILSDGAAKHRLGSGRVEPFPIHAPFSRGEVVLLLSDGAWTPLSLHGLQRLVAGAALGGFADLPGRILDAAGRTGRADDMTAVVGRLGSR